MHVELYLCICRAQGTYLKPLMAGWFQNTASRAQGWGISE